MIELSSQSLAKDHAITSLGIDEKSKAWKKEFDNNFVHQTLQPFVYLKDIRIAGIYLCIYVKHSIYSFIENIQISSVSVGVLGKIVCCFILTFCFYFENCFLFI